MKKVINKSKHKPSMLRATKERRVRVIVRLEPTIKMDMDEKSKTRIKKELATLKTRI